VRVGDEPFSKLAQLVGIQPGRNNERCKYPVMQVTDPYGSLVQLGGHMLPLSVQSDPGRFKPEPFEHTLKWKKKGKSRRRRPLLERIRVWRRTKFFKILTKRVEGNARAALLPAGTISLRNCVKRMRTEKQEEE
jgi:hypothetical protein